MSTKHTPGPWTQYRDSRGNVRIQGNVNGGPVAFIEEMNNTGGTEQDHANARLIAAAPELLEAAANVFDKLWENYGNGYGTEYEDVIAQLQVVITKATNG